MWWRGERERGGVKKKIAYVFCFLSLFICLVHLSCFFVLVVVVIFFFHLYTKYIFSCQNKKCTSTTRVLLELDRVNNGKFPETATQRVKSAATK